MATDLAKANLAGFLHDVRDLMAQAVREAVYSAGLPPADELLLGGKFLRSRLAARVMAGRQGAGSSSDMKLACAATELVHTASLCHDDVIDAANLRRGKETLWRLVSSTGAVLTGDILLCKAMELVLEMEDRAAARRFVGKTEEVCRGEMLQELQPPEADTDEKTLLRIARLKTGPLFAFPLATCAAGDAELALALEEAGYRIGTAYQLVDDLIDVIGMERCSGKSLSKDRECQKTTLAQGPAEALGRVRAHVTRLGREAVRCMRGWDCDGFSGGIELFLKEDLARVVAPHDESLARQMQNLI